VFRTVGDHASWWESLLPEELLVLPAELVWVDVLLDDAVFFTPFMPFFDARMGRPSSRWNLSGVDVREGPLPARLRDGRHRVDRRAGGNGRPA
jgi:hypothetical protein